MSLTIKQLHTFAIKQTEEGWHRECRGDYKAAWSQLRQDLKFVADSGIATQRIGSFDCRATLLKLTLWKSIEGDLKDKALRHRDEFLMLCCLRVQLGLAQLQARHVYEYLDLSVRDGKEMDKMITKFIGIPLRFPRTNYRQVFKKEGDGRKRPKKGWAREVIRREKYYVEKSARNRNKRKSLGHTKIDQETVSDSIRLGERELKVEYSDTQDHQRQD